MLASLLQELLGNVGGGELEHGKLRHMWLARATRIRVIGRVRRICRIWLPENVRIKDFRSSDLGV